MLDLARRPVAEEAYRQLTAAGLPPLIARLYASRGVADAREIRYPLANMLPVERLTHAGTMAGVLADAIAAGRRMLIVADYDADGATACAVGLRALRQFGARIDFIVPNRFEYGYGLTPEIVRLAHREKQPDLIITVDNGIASVDGVDEAARLGIEVLVTDHHLPGDELPRARAIVNPNQPGCTFPSKNLAGVGVMFYVMAALRAELRRRGAFAGRAEPNLGALLDLVALGTVADVVRLDSNNRILVHQGLQRIRQGRAQPGVLALYAAAGRDPARASTYDLGFVLGPRLNAAGRLDDMSLGIECLATDDHARAAAIAGQLDELNRNRRTIETQMHESALERLPDTDVHDAYSVCMFDPQWHQGVVGILASRLKERFHRPVIAFAQATDGTLKGSGRSIPALHLRDAIDIVAKRHPGLIHRFGGHAAAAGLTIAQDAFAAFAAAFERSCSELLTAADLARVIETDGPLPPAELVLRSAEALQDDVWGQGFAPPVFDDEFEVVSQRIVGERHTRLVLAAAGAKVEAMLFFSAVPLPGRLRAVYRLGINEYGGARRLQLAIEHWSPAP
jgi:single-stranded-DNA-specific exonuclease